MKKSIEKQEKSLLSEKDVANFENVIYNVIQEKRKKVQRWRVELFKNLIHLKILGLASQRTRVDSVQISKSYLADNFPPHAYII